MKVAEQADVTQAMLPLVAALRAAARQDHAAFYTPGHKRGQGISSEFAALLGKPGLQADLPELPELDNLFAPQGVIRDAQQLASDAFGAAQTWFLANGSTCGLEAAVLAVCRAGETVILPRNSHQSAIAALILSGAVPVFVDPIYDLPWDLAHTPAVTTIQQALDKHPDAKAVMLVHPTYYGVCGQIEAIAQLVHEHGIPLLIDEAHGAHFAFHDQLPISALEAGADLTVQSTHKVLGAMTQASMLHIGSQAIATDWAARLPKCLQLVQSTSPNYLLLASLDAARHQMAMQGQSLMDHALALSQQGRSQLAKIPGIRVLEASDLPDPSLQLDTTRLTVDVSGLGITGFEADAILSEQGVVAELPSLKHLTFIVSFGNQPQDLARLVQGVRDLSQHGSSTNSHRLPDQQLLSQDPVYPVAELSPREAFLASHRLVPIQDAVHHLSAATVCPYPPGIPVLFPGELITPEAIARLETVRSAGGWITGCADPNGQMLTIVDN